MRVSFCIDGIPLDGTIILNITHTFELGLVVAFDILATFGLIFTIGCLILSMIQVIVHL